MNTLHDFKDHRKSLEEMKSLVEAYQEVAAMRMQKVRKAVLNSRDFLFGLLKVFSAVKQVATKNTKHQAPSTQHQSRAAVFISANSGLYGDIVNKTFNQFKTFIQANPSNLVVLGRLGVRLMTENMPNMLYNYFDFSDDRVEWSQLTVVMRYLLKFDQVVVFYGQFQSIVVQHVEAIDIMGEEKQILADTKSSKKAYLFEPNAEEIVRVFSSEVVSSIFDQSVHESQLAKFASRIVHLDQSLEQIETKIKENIYLGHQVEHKYFSKKQQQRLAGMNLWNT